MADAHTRIFHELMEPLLMLDLSGVQFRIIFWVARNSYGWGGKMTTPFSWSKIARDIKADRRGVSRQGADLIARGILLSDDAAAIGINKAGVRSLALGQPSRGWDKNPMGQKATKMGTTVPGAILIVKERKETDSVEANGFKAKDLLALYNERAASLGLSKVRGLTPDRQRHAAARLAEEPSRETWISALDKVSVSAFLRGDNDRKWCADFDWLIKPGSLTKLLEGKYGNGAASPAAPSVSRAAMVDPGTAAYHASRLEAA